MKRISFWLFATVLTFVLGVAAAFVWFNYQHSKIETVQSKLFVEAKPDIASEKRKADISELARNRQLWKEQNIVNYSFVGEQFAGGMYIFIPMQIKVENSKTISMKLTGKNPGLLRTDGYDKFNTVEKIFDEIQTAIDRAVSLNVTYDKEHGFPEKISISPINAGEDMYFRIQITEFEITKTN
jgi:Family of unknown function (DUF6174)